MIKLSRLENGGAIHVTSNVACFQLRQSDTILASDA